MKQARLGLWITMTLILLAAALAVEAQPGKVYRIGYLGIAPVSTAGPLREAFRDGLRDLGYVEGQNLILEFRSAEGQAARLPGLARELAGLPVDVLVVWPMLAVQAAKQATTNIPIVVPIVGDPVECGLVASLARPGGNLTGMAGVDQEIGGKLVEFLKAIRPKLSR